MMRSTSSLDVRSHARLHAASSSGSIANGLSGHQSIWKICQSEIGRCVGASSAGWGSLKYSYG
jgi:hypothetical protein